jgi:hypothetical protein
MVSHRVAKREIRVRIAWRLVQSNWCEAPIGGLASPQEIIRTVSLKFQHPLKGNPPPFKIACFRPDSSFHLENANCHHSIHTIQIYEHPKTDFKRF